MENYVLVAGLIAAHPNREVSGRMRLQKTVCLAQRIGLGTNYSFSIFSNGPYSEELNSDILTIQKVGLGTVQRGLQGNGQIVAVRARPEVRKAQLDPLQTSIQTLASTEPKVLEIAATYDIFREMGSDHLDALRRLRAKKGAGIENADVDKAFCVLRSLGLPAPELDCGANP